MNNSLCWENPNYWYPTDLNTLWKEASANAPIFWKHEYHKYGTNDTSSKDRATDRQTDGQTDRHTLQTPLSPGFAKPYHRKSKNCKTFALNTTPSYNPSESLARVYKCLYACTWWADCLFVPAKHNNCLNSIKPLNRQLQNHYQPRYKNSFGKQL